MPSSSSSPIIVAFDVYGTLLSTASIAKELASHFEQEKATAIAGKWRVYQLEYTWRLNSMQQYEPFSAVTRRSLKHTLAEFKESLCDGDIEELMKAYDQLGCFEDVKPALQRIGKEEGITAVVFSNGTHSMVSNSVNNSPDLGPHASIFKEIVTVEEPRLFKPAPQVYQHLAKRMGKVGKMSEMWLVSGNPFDVVGARSCGMQAAWVDREGNGWADGLVEGEKGRPTVVVRELGEVVNAVRKYGSGVQ